MLEQVTPWYDTVLLLGVGLAVLVVPPACLYWYLRLFRTPGDPVVNRP